MHIKCFSALLDQPLQEKNMSFKHKLFWHEGTLKGSFSLDRLKVLKKGITFKHKISYSNYIGFADQLWCHGGSVNWDITSGQPCDWAPPPYFVYICLSAIPFSIYFGHYLLKGKSFYRIGPSSQGCPRCGGSVFKAEEVIEKGRTYHKKCFTCVKCNRPQDDKLQVWINLIGIKACSDTSVSAVTSN